MPSQITVRKIPAQEIPPPVKDPVGKPVIGLAKVRLTNNLIIQNAEGKSVLLTRGSVVDIGLIPPHLQTDQLIEAPEAFREGKIMMLHDFTCAVPSFDGQSTVWREKLFPVWSLQDPASIPVRIMEGLIEGEDYASQWDENDRKLREIERRNATEEFPMEPDIPDDVSDGRDPHNRYYGESL